MRNKILFVISAMGLVLAVASAVIFNRQPSAQPPLFNPAANPYANGIYANGIIETVLAEGQNINIFPEVSGPVAKVLVAEGEAVKKGDPLLTIDDSVQRATTEQQRAQAEAALALVEELRAQPRPETLAIAAAQVENAQASLKSAQDQLARQERSYAIDPKSVSGLILDTARDAAEIADTSLKVAQKQYALTKAGAWSFDIRNQERQYAALSQAYAASSALLGKYIIRAPADGVVLTLQASIGSYVSPQGAYDSYTQGMKPLVVMGTPEDRLQVRAFIDEILVHRLADPSRIEAQMFIRGTDTRVPLVFAGIQPYVSPKIELADSRQERVDVRVLPVIFRFERPRDVNLYPGQLVDVYVGAK